MKPTLSIIDGTEADADLYIQIIIILCGFITFTGLYSIDIICRWPVVMVEDV